jgi:predicted MPP superfamily phosphohydrolase
LHGTIQEERHSCMTRRKFLYSALGSSLVYPCYLEPRWLDVTRQTVRLHRPGIAPFKILHLSDLHASLLVPQSMIHRAITAGLAERPDLICVTGDFVTHRQDFHAAEYAATLRRLSAAAPTFAVMGNHDGGEWASHHMGNRDHRVVDRILEDAHIELLHNRSVGVEARGAALNIVGVGDLWSDEVDAGRAFRGVGGGRPTIVLAHNPDTKEELRRPEWDLMLSGHTHGGQVVIGFDGSRYAPVEDKRYVAGLKPWGTRQIHVTRGVGNIAGVRFRCRPEASLLTVV